MIGRYRTPCKTSESPNFLACGTICTPNQPEAGQGTQRPCRQTFSGAYFRDAATAPFWRDQVARQAAAPLPKQAASRPRLGFGGLCAPLHDLFGRSGATRAPRRSLWSPRAQLRTARVRERGLGGNKRLEPFTCQYMPHMSTYILPVS